MSRKILSFLVVLAMLVSSISFAFAAESKLTDGITDEKVKAAVARLGALGMTQGLDDGTFGADQALNRAQAATFIVRALGLESAAEAAAGQATVFSDVPGTHWAAGYISVAQGQGLVEGVGDGVFAPEAPYTYAAAVTVLCRALGYKNDFLPGSWPGNYLAKAADLKLTKGVTFAPNGVATRGSFAVLLNNTLDTDIVKVEAYTSTGIDYKVDEGNTLLEDKLEITKFDNEGDGYRFIQNYRLGAAEDKVVIDLNDNGAVDADEDFEIADATMDVETLLGVKVNYYTNDDDEIVYMEQNGSATVYYELVDNMDTDNDNDTDTKEAKFKYSGKVFEVDADASIYVDGTLGDDTTVKAAQFGKFVVSGSKIIFADVYGNNGANTWAYKALLVKKIENGKIYYYETDGDEANINPTNLYDGGYVVKMTTSSTPIALTDIQALDVLYIGTSDNGDGDTVGAIFVVRNVKTGKAGTVTGDEDNAATVELDGTSYTLGADASYSTDNNDDMTAFDADAKKDPTDTADDAPVNTLDGYYGNTVTAYLGIDNKIRHIVGDADVSTTKYGVLTQVLEDSDSVKIMTPAGDIVTYALEDDSDIGTYGAAETEISGMGDKDSYEEGDLDDTLYGMIEAGIVIAKYEVNKDGEIAEGTLELMDATDASGDAEVINDLFDDGFRITDANGDVLDVNTGSVVVFDMTGMTGNTEADEYVIDDVETSTWTALSDKDVPDSGLEFVYFTSSDKVVAIFITEGDVTDDAQGAYILNTTTVDGDDFLKVHVVGETAAKLVQLRDDRTSTTDVNFAGYKESARAIKMYGDKIEVVANADVDDEDFSFVGGEVYKIDGTKLYINGDSAADGYKTVSNVLVYSGGTLKALTDVQVGDMVVGLVNDEGKIEVIEWTASDTDDDYVAVDAKMKHASAGTFTFDVDNDGTYNESTTWEANDASMVFDNVNGVYVYKAAVVGTHDNALALTGATHYNVKVWKKVGENKVRSVQILSAAVAD